MTHVAGCGEQRESKDVWGPKEIPKGPDSARNTFAFSFLVLCNNMAGMSTATFSSEGALRMEAMS